MNMNAGCADWCDSKICRSVLKLALYYYYTSEYLFYKVK